MITNQYHFSKKNIRALLRVIFFYVLSVTLFIIISGFTKTFSKPFGELLSLMVASLLTLLLIVIFTKWEKLSLKQVGIVPGKLAIGRFLSGCFIGFVAVSLQVLIVYAFNHLTLKLVSPLNIKITLLHLILYLMVAFREELVFRSYTLRTLDYKFRSVFALSVITLIFIAEHLAAGMDLKTAIIGPGLGGILFGIAALKTKGLALPLGLHFAWNFGQWLTGFKNSPGIWEAIVDKGFEREMENIGLIAYIFVMILTIIIVLIFYKTPRQNEGLKV